MRWALGGAQQGLSWGGGQWGGLQREGSPPWGGDSWHLSASGAAAALCWAQLSSAPASALLLVRSLSCQQALCPGVTPLLGQGFMSTP